MLFGDSSASMEGYRITAAGFLVGDVRFARTGIQVYGGLELDRRDMAVVSVYRSPAAVFDMATMRSFAMRPITMGHPPDGVSADTWKQHSIGYLNDEIARDGDYVRGTIVVQDGAAIEMIKNGTRELSAGYQCDVQWEAGNAPDGQAYQAVQRSIRGNHVAIVTRGRAGAACRIGSSA